MEQHPTLALRGHLGSERSVEFCFGVLVWWFKFHSLYSRLGSYLIRSEYYLSIARPPSQCNTFKAILCADIHCLRTPTQERLTAFLRIPSGFNSAPVLEDVRHELLNPSVGGEECLVGAVETTPGLFALDLSRLSECGVRQCAVENEEDWLCVMVRWVARAAAAVGLT